METNRSVFRLSTLCSDVMNQPVPALKIDCGLSTKTV